MMRVLLSKADPSTGHERAYETTISEDLFGWHMVVSRWGSLGHLRMVKEEAFQSFECARARVAELTLARVQRGYGPRTKTRQAKSRRPSGLSWRQSQAIARSLLGALEPKDERQLNLGFPAVASEHWAHRIIQECYGKPSLAERLYGPSFQLILARLLRYREFNPDCEAGGKVVRLVPRSFQAFAAYSLRTFFSDEPRLSGAVDVITDAHILSVAELVQLVPSQLEQELGLSRETVSLMRSCLAEIGLDFGMCIPRAQLERIGGREPRTA